jgi:hypothetical protein
MRLGEDEGAYYRNIGASVRETDDGEVPA